jgi:hypothetical protein
VPIITIHHQPKQFITTTGREENKHNEKEKRKHSPCLQASCAGVVIMLLPVNPAPPPLLCLRRSSRPLKAITTNHLIMAASQFISAHHHSASTIPFLFTVAAAHEQMPRKIEKMQSQTRAAAMPNPHKQTHGLFILQSPTNSISQVTAKITKAQATIIPNHPITTHCRA